MLNAAKIASFLDEILRTKEIVDSSVNGLQVDCKVEIEKIGFAVDASLETFQRAVETGCQMLIVHHGMIWGGLGPIVGMNFQRLEFLFENNLALYASHLPLDLHPEYGNNIQLAKLLKLSHLEPFGCYKGTVIGFIGETDCDLDEILKVLEQNRMKTILLPFGPKTIKKLAIVSGGASDSLTEAIEKGADLFLTGEAIHSTHHMAKESRINVIFGGHYETEVWGVKALMPVLEKEFGIKTEFIDVPCIV